MLYQNVRVGEQSQWYRALVALATALIAIVLYVLTLAPGTLFGDPTEYQFIPAIWGIAHPPGYAFYTLLAGVWQRVVVLGSIAYRTNLLAAAMGAWIASRIALITAELAGTVTTRRTCWTTFAALMAGIAVATAPDVWQHSIHANAHIVSAAITSTQLWVLVRWQNDRRRRWLYALALLVGLGVTHHPITVWGIPAYGVFVLLQQPDALKDKQLILGVLLACLTGLLPWLYFPLRSPTTPFGPTDMATWQGFIRHATAQGLRVNLFHFGLADQPDRWYVFANLLQLQYGWLFIFLMVLGFLYLLVNRPRIGVLWGLFLIGHLGFTLNSVQDVMAYLLHVFSALAVLLGLGVLSLVALMYRRRAWMGYATALGLVLLLAIRIGYAFPRVSLHTWHEADAFFEELETQFRGKGSGAALVADWEHLTPYFYYKYVAGRGFDEEDLRPIYVTGAQPWLESVFGNLPLGPVYLTNYRREVRASGVRLRPMGSLWRASEPPTDAPVAPQHSLVGTFVDGRLELVGYDLPLTRAAQGQVIPLTLYARVPVSETEILMPFVRLGEVEDRWTTDSRRLTPEWLPGEIIAERYEIFIPYDLPPGRYPLQLGFTQMTGRRRDLDFATGHTLLPLGEINVSEAPEAVRIARVLQHSLTNIGNAVALRTAWTQVGLRLRVGSWERPLSMKPGQTLHLTLVWRALARPRTSYTVFIHLMDAQGHLWLGHDYTPLGGAFPSYLWFPKWLEGQTGGDPYRLVLPETLPPGKYWLEVGMYEMGSVRRIPQLGKDGSLIGDRYLLGPIQVTAW